MSRPEKLAPRGIAEVCGFSSALKVESENTDSGPLRQLFSNLHPTAAEQASVFFNPTGRIQGILPKLGVTTMASERKRAAARANSLASTGPKSAPGKARTRLNSVKHGAFSVQRLLPGEDPKEFKRLTTSVYAETNPKTAIECMLVDQIIADMWRLKRIQRAELVCLEEAQNYATQKVLISLSEDEFTKAKDIIKDCDIVEKAHSERMSRAATRALYSSFRSFDEEPESEEEQLDFEESEFESEDEVESPPQPETAEMNADSTRQMPLAEVTLDSVKQKLDAAIDPGNLLLHQLYSPATESRLKNTRRSLVRDIIQKYADLVKLQEHHLTIDS